jgi:hypothetical protein
VVSWVRFVERLSEADLGFVPTADAASPDFDLEPAEVVGDCSFDSESSAAACFTLAWRIETEAWGTGGLRPALVPLT